MSTPTPDFSSIAGVVDIIPVEMPHSGDVVIVTIDPEVMEVQDTGLLRIPDCVRSEIRNAMTDDMELLVLDDTGALADIFSNTDEVDHFRIVVVPAPNGRSRSRSGPARRVGFIAHDRRLSARAGLPPVSIFADVCSPAECDLEAFIKPMVIADPYPERLVERSYDMPWSNARSRSRNRNAGKRSRRR